VVDACSDRDGFKMSWSVLCCCEMPLCLSCGIVTLPNQMPVALQCADTVFVRLTKNASVPKPKREIRHNALTRRSVVPRRNANASGKLPFLREPRKLKRHSAAAVSVMLFWIHPVVLFDDSFHAKAQ